MKTIKKKVLINFDVFRKILDRSDETDFFSQKEIELYGNKKGMGSYAVRYALKKSLQAVTCIDFYFPEVEVVNSDDGKPELYMSLALKKEIEKKGMRNIHFSLSHSGKRGAVLLIIEQDDV